MNCDEHKRIARAEAMNRRSEAHERARAQWDAAALGDRLWSHLDSHILSRFPFSPGAMVSGYVAGRGEIDVLGILSRLYEKGYGCGLPVMEGKAKPLLFRSWQPGMALEAGSFAIPVPGPERAEICPSLLLVPCLAFDDAGYRLGYGGGYYDRTLEALRKSRGDVLAVGVAYAGQQCEHVPHDDLDQPLDWMISEEKVFGPFEKKAGKET